jgi:hypothetical protein
VSVFYGTIRAVKTAAGSLGAVLLQLREFGVLPKTDARLPSALAILAVEPVAGSWWSHPRAHEIFRALESLADHPISGKQAGCPHYKPRGNRLWHTGAHQTEHTGLRR